MYPRLSVAMLCLVSLVVMGAVVLFGFLSLGSMQEVVPQQQHLVLSHSRLARTESALHNARAGAYAFLVTMDGAKARESVAALGATAALALEAREDFLGQEAKTMLETLSRKCGEMSLSVKEIEEAAVMVGRMYSDVAVPHCNRARQIIREEVFGDRETPGATSFGTALLESLSAAGAGLKAFTVTRTAADANGFQADLTRTLKMIDAKAAGLPQQRPYIDKLRAEVDTLQKAFDHMRETSDKVYWHLSALDRNFHAQASALRVLSKTADNVSNEWIVWLSQRFEKQLLVMMSVSAGGVLLTLLLGLSAIIGIARDRRKR